jgi:SAM-dependent methyltransferase
MKSPHLVPACLAVLIAGVVCNDPAVAQSQLVAPRLPDVIYVPTPQPVVDAMLKMANVQAGEMVYDLGCGDGRAVITAARDFGARGIGVDIDPERIQESLANAVSAGVADRVEFKQEDLFQMRFSDADVLFLYLLPALNLRLRPRILDELRPGTRVVSHAFTMGDWEHDEKAVVNSKTIFFWRVPAKVAGTWKVSLPGGEEGTLSLTQEFQNVKGTLKTKDKTHPLVNARLAGTKLTFDFAQSKDSGQANAEITGDRFTGTLRRGSAGREEPWSGQLMR